MSSIATEPTTQKDDGQPQIPVENPATGEVIGHVPDMSAAQIAELARRGRAAQPGWEALGYEGRAVVLKRMQRWLVDNADQVIATICSETGMTYEDAQIAELIYGAAAFGFWADKAPRYLADERIHSSSVFVKGKRLVLRYRPMGLIGVIGPWNYPLTNSFGDCIPALAAGNSVILKPSEVTPLTSLLLAQGLAESGLPDGVFAVATGRGGTGAAVIDEVDMIMSTGFHRHRAQGRGPRRRAPDTGIARARWQGPDDRARRCRHRAGSQPRRLLFDVQLRSNVHLYRALLRGGAGLRRVRREGHRKGACDPPGRTRRPRQRRRRVTDLPTASRNGAAPRRGSG